MHGRAWSGAACAALWTGLAWSVATAAETAPQQAPASRIAWQTLARSVEDRVIEYCRFGQGDEHVLVVASLAGDESEGVELAERLASHLEQFPRRLGDTTVTIVRDPNPDGRFRRTPGNARGVMLDQNFRTRHWRRSPLGERWPSGREPESEPETRALADLLDDLKPARVIVLDSSRCPGVLNYAGPAEDLSQQVAVAGRMRTLPLNAADAAGALAASAGIDRGIPTLVFHLPARATVESNWSTYKRALLAAIDAKSNASSGDKPSAAAAASSDNWASGPPAGAETQEPRRLSAAALPIAMQTPASATAADASPPAEAPRVLSAKDLQKGLALVPIGAPPSDAKAKRPPNTEIQPVKPSGPLFSAASPSPAANKLPPPSAAAPRPSYLRSPPPVDGWRPKLSAAPFSAQAVPSSQPETAAVIERFPPVERRKPSARKLRQEPIPFYPRTGL